MTSFQQSVSIQLAMMKACAHILWSRAYLTASRRSPRRRSDDISSRSAVLTPYETKGVEVPSFVRFEAAEAS